MLWNWLLANPRGNIFSSFDSSHNKKKTFERKMHELKDKGKKKFILLVDSIYSENKDINWHFIYKEKMKFFFEEFLKLQSSNKRIGLIIKSKIQMLLIYKNILFSNLYYLLQKLSSKN